MKSLTATIHLPDVNVHLFAQFEQKCGKTKQVEDNEIELLSRILDQASEASPELQEIILKFADYIKDLNKQSPG